MIVRDLRRLLIILIPCLVLVYTGIRLYGETPVIPSRVNEWIQPVISGPHLPSLPESPSRPIPPDTPLSPASPLPPASPQSTSPEDGIKVDLPKEQGSHSSFSEWWAGFGGFGKPAPTGPPPDLRAPSTHYEIFSSSTPNRQYFKIDFNGKKDGINPNMIPHPTLENTWIVVAQEVRKPDDKSPKFVELVCDATFKDGALKCLKSPTELPVKPTKGGKCEGDLSYVNFNVGPHDARVLYGPDKPYIVFGTNSQYTCFGQNIQDFRELVNWGIEKTGSPDFVVGTELQRPEPWHAIEKNWFPFWDNFGQMYIHYDIAPKRSFAKVDSNGTAGEDLGPFGTPHDTMCMAKYLPKLPPTLESIHQATNSLKLTMCRRADLACIPNELNTFILTIWQHKTFYDFHGVYEPYAMLFAETAPFAIHGISKRPIWIHGRQQYEERRTSDMLYVTSLTWKSSQVKYHGYLDDELFLGFGIEDSHSGGIDLTAQDLLRDLGLCVDI